MSKGPDQAVHNRSARGQGMNRDSERCGFRSMFPVAAGEGQNKIGF